MNLTTCLVLTLISLLVFVTYNAAILGVFGVPKSLSESFYLLQSKNKGLGYIFTGVMFIMAFTLMPACIEITEVVSDWSHYLTVLPFFGAAMIAFVGAAPAFRSCELESKVHTVAASLAAVFSLAWCLIVTYQVGWIITITWSVLMVIVGVITRTLKKSFTYWMEVVALGAIFTTIISELLVLM